MDSERRRAVLRLGVAVTVLSAASALAALVVVRFATSDPANAPIPKDAPPGLEEAAERSCVLGYPRVGSRTSHIVEVDARGPGAYAVRCALGPLDAPSWYTELECSGGEWSGPQGAGPNGSHGPYDIAC